MWRCLRSGFHTGSWEIQAFCIFLDHAAGAKDWCNCCDCFLDSGDPPAWNPIWPIIIQRTHLVFENMIQMLRVVPILFILIGILAFFANRPTIAPVIGFWPPAIEDRAVDDTIQAGLLAAGAAGLVWATGCVQPDIDAMNEIACNAHVVFFEEHNPARKAILLRHLIDLLNEDLAWMIGGMGLAGKHNLDWAIAAIDDIPQPISIAEQQCGPFVGRKATRKPNRQGILIEQWPGNRWRVQACMALERPLASECNQFFLELVPNRP